MSDSYQDEMTTYSALKVGDCFRVRACGIDPKDLFMKCEAWEGQPMAVRLSGKECGQFMSFSDSAEVRSSERDIFDEVAHATERIRLRRMAIETETKA